MGGEPDSGGGAFRVVKRFLWYLGIATALVGFGAGMMLSDVVVAQAKQRLKEGDLRKARVDLATL